MVTDPQENLEIVLLDYLGAIRKGDQEALRAVLDPDVTWQGLHEEWACHGPDEVIETLQEGLRMRRDVAALEFVRAGDRVVMGVRGPAIDEVGGEPLERADLQRLHTEERKDRPHRGLSSPDRGPQVRWDRRGSWLALAGTTRRRTWEARVASRHGRSRLH